jgi:tetratricopeptide (TPR) repeat protein
MSAGAYREAFDAGDTAHRGGSVEEARDHFTLAIELYETLDDRVNRVNNTNNLGECYYDLGALDQARSAFESARAGRDVNPALRGPFSRPAPAAMRS